jgi:hypothetical protein
MAREKLSPRSYVTGGFDILRPALIDAIGKILRRTGNSWWYDCIYKELPKKIIKDYDIHREGNVNTMHQQFDEYVCFRICRSNKNKNVLEKSGLRIFWGKNHS